MALKKKSDNIEVLLLAGAGAVPEAAVGNKKSDGSSQKDRSSLTESVEQENGLPEKDGPPQNGRSDQTKGSPQKDRSPQTNGSDQTDKLPQKDGSDQTKGSLQKDRSPQTDGSDLADGLPKKYGSPQNNGSDQTDGSPQKDRSPPTDGLSKKDGPPQTDGSDQRDGSPQSYKLAQTDGSARSEGSVHKDGSWIEKKTTEWQTFLIPDSTENTDDVTLLRITGAHGATGYNNFEETTKDSKAHDSEKAENNVIGIGEVRLNQHLQQGKPEQINQPFHRLHLEENHGSKLRAADLLQITAHSLQSHECCAEDELVQTFLQQLLMMNYRARNIKTRETNEHCQTKQKDDDSLDDEGDIFEEMSLCSNISKPDPVYPMDVQMAVFHCADSFLKQLMVTKLSQCQFALPLLFPDPFTQQIQFPLWTFRQINKSWRIRNADNDIINKVQPVYEANTPMVSFFRFSSVSSSKSQLMNSLINEKHNTFFHRNCPGSSRTRLLMEGMVEIAWYCPSGKNTDTFSRCVAFCNLHGDAGANEKQLQILTEMSSVNVVILPKLDKNDINAKKIQSLYKCKKPLICLLTEDESFVSETKKSKFKIGLKGRNQSDVSEELRRTINDCLSSSETASMFKLEDVSKYSGIRVDEEDDEDCKKGKNAAQQLMSLLKDKELAEIKESFLPCQGKLWHLWCEKNKELHQPQVEEIEQEISRKKTEMMTIREEQHKSQMSAFIKTFITQINSRVINRIFFLKWLKILLDEFTSADLSALHHTYNEKWSTVLKLKDKPEQLKTEQTDLERISEELQAATFGLEHILREIGQIYESCSCVKKNKTELQFDFSCLPSLAAEMMISGFPLELMDGDAAHVPLTWVTAVLKELIQKLGDHRVFVLSVLGIQSSGKSTMLNAMFGLEFAVSAGRCTRGAFMQLIKVSEEMKEKLKFDYILLVDTEGLRALEMAGRSTRHHDNEMATFVVGLGNLTLINIFGENPSEMQDILQIVVQAFLRMKKVKLNPSCMFVHQNVSDITAGEKNMEGRRRLQETLDKMTRLAAKDEVCDAECFNDVISFDVRKDVKYFAQLWEGSPPLAPPNPNYCENIQELKQAIISHASKSSGMRLSHLRGRVQDLWKALLNEQFVFSFRNSVEISAYKKLETEYNKWSWTLRSAMLEIENKLQNQIENETTDIVEETCLLGDLKETSEGVKKAMLEFFEKDTDKDILVQWKVSFGIKIRELQENIVRKTKTKLNEILQQRDLKKKIDNQRTHHENTLLEKSKELALKHKDKTNNEEILKKEFDLFWKECVKKITTDTPPIKDADILKDMKTVFCDIYKSVPLHSCEDHGDIFSVTSFLSYVQLNKPLCTVKETLVEAVKHPCRSAKEALGYILSDEDEVQIGNLISDVDQETQRMIISFNIAKMGYNISYIHHLTSYIKDRVTEYEKRPARYVFKNEFFKDLVFSICEKADKTFTAQHSMFKETNDPFLYLERKRKEYYSIFKKYCQGATSAAIFGEIICQKLKEPIEQSVYKHISRDIANEMRSNCRSLNGNRSNLEKHILERLAQDENFLAYKSYIQHPVEHFKWFIRDEVKWYITDNFSRSIQLKMKQNIEILQKNLITAAYESTEHVQVNSEDIHEWLNFFTQKLSDVLVFSVKDFIGVKHDDVGDFKLLEEVIRTKLPSIMSDISRVFSIDTYYLKLDHRNRADENLIDHFCQCCWVQCPFCRAICTNTIENHDGDHSVPFHRVVGIKGMFYKGTENLSVSICTSAVASNRSFHSHDLNDCPVEVQWKDYRKAGPKHANWSITPDLSELPYWKWFVCKFQKDLEGVHKKTFQECGKIPDEWKKITKQDALESLAI
ncbi:GTPase 1 Interferon-induced very large [Triplophysa tibetana]|uniref:GTPase 1 Interferon-induced very large n=1 Tax=Triplophysa tibetana TaxID=1572043 RepID=A0A5A9NHL5_9TELE|nr:GTPase 1 Interferon-induced very large [Triplophysa tibetana]